jgi:hypothetical protein
LNCRRERETRREKKKIFQKGAEVFRVYLFVTLNTGEKRKHQNLLHERRKRQRKALLFSLYISWSSSYKTRKRGKPPAETTTMK